MIFNCFKIRGVEIFCARLATLTLNGRGGGGVEPPPTRFFIYNFMFVKKKNPKMRDFLIIGIKKKI